MSFDVYLLDQLDYEDAREQLYDYSQALLEHFSESPEGKAYCQQTSDYGYWITRLVEMGYIYAEVTLPQMTEQSVGEIVSDIFPRKITLLNRQDADPAIPELVALWTFLRREYQFLEAEEVIQYLEKNQAKFVDWMFDPRRAGMAKSFMMGGQASGFDMTTEEGMRAYQQAFNVQSSLFNAMDAADAQDIAKQVLSDRRFGVDESTPFAQSKSSKRKPKKSSKGFGAFAKKAKSKRKSQ